jgi:glycosyltransferase EpsD
LSKFYTDEGKRIKKRRELNIPENSFVILSVGELNKNKNHETVIRALSKITNKNILYFICGQGMLKNYLIELIQELGLSNQVKLLGFRNDLEEIYQTADLFAFPSYREGLSVSLMEAMASGLPIVCSDIRGNRDLVKKGINGYSLSTKDVEGYQEAIVDIITNQSLSKQMGLNNISTIKKFDKNVVKNTMQKIYLKVNSYEGT